VQRYPLVLVLLAAAALPVAPVDAQQEQPFSSLEERMTGEEFERTGLDKLSADELAALNEWIRERSVADYEPPARSGQPTAGATASVDQMPREPIDSRIDGTFEGWTGYTVFELENGMVWRQDERDRYRVRPMENPRVTVRPGFGGSWRLTVEGHNRGVRVERIE
jgi:hypothetical protein